MEKEVKIVHYLNQFFGRIGGEEKANVGPNIKEGAIGPGVALQNALKGRGKIVATVICGDNYYAEKIDQATQEIIQLITTYKPDAITAGPAFNAGRYGIACGALCTAIQEKLRIPAITGMYEDSPGADLYRKYVYIIKTGDSAKGMSDAVTKMANLVCKLAAGQEAGLPAEDGYIPRGLLKEVMADKIGAERTVDMILAKVMGKPYETELHAPRFDRVKPATAVKDLSKAKIALVTDGGLVPKGNPDKIEIIGATKFARYSIEGMKRLAQDAYDVAHVGYDPTQVKKDPNRLVPLDVMRDLEEEGIIGKIDKWYYATTGVGTTIDYAKKIAKGIAEKLKEDGVDAVILTST